jgi:hypothetical protein
MSVFSPCQCARITRLEAGARENKSASLLRKLARDQENPGLAEGLDGTWLPEQIAAIVREILRDPTIRSGV